MSDQCPICGESVSRHRRSPVDNPTYCTKCREQVAINREAYEYETEYDPLIPIPRHGSVCGFYSDGLEDTSVPDYARGEVY